MTAQAIATAIEPVSQATGTFAQLKRKAAPIAQTSSRIICFFVIIKGCTTTGYERATGNEELLLPPPVFKGA
jgi:hypothetical protein